MLFLSEQQLNTHPLNVRMTETYNLLSYNLYYNVMDRFCMMILRPRMERCKSKLYLEENQGLEAFFQIVRVGIVIDILNIIIIFQ